MWFDCGFVNLSYDSKDNFLCSQQRYVVLVVNQFYEEKSELIFNFADSDSIVLSGDCHMDSPVLCVTKQGNILLRGTCLWGHCPHGEW